MRGWEEEHARVIRTCTIVLGAKMRPAQDIEVDFLKNGEIGYLSDTCDL